MNDLRIPVSLITEEGYEIDGVVSGSSLRPADAAALPLGTVQVTGRISKSDENYIFLGRVEGTYETTCDRCLDPASVGFGAEVVWVFVEGESTPPPDDEDADENWDVDEADESSDITYFVGPDLDLAPRVWEEAVFSVPPKMLCKSDCAGLCPECGANLNRETCTCSTTNKAEESLGNRGLAGLGNLFPDLPKKPSED